MHFGKLIASVSQEQVWQLFLDSLQIDLPALGLHYLDIQAVLWIFNFLDNMRLWISGWDLNAPAFLAHFRIGDGQLITIVPSSLLFPPRLENPSLVITP